MSGPNPAGFKWAVPRDGFLEYSGVSQNPSTPMLVEWPLDWLTHTAEGHAGTVAT